VDTDSTEEVARLRFVQRAKLLGLTLEEIKELVELALRCNEGEIVRRLEKVLEANNRAGGLSTGPSRTSSRATIALETALQHSGSHSEQRNREPLVSWPDVPRGVSHEPQNSPFLYRTL
jgi:DNA-binding transcriptional MerR regulator